MLYLTNRLNLNLQNGDKIEITVIETPGGGARLGITTTARKPLAKALADVEILPVRKGKGQPSAAPDPTKPITRRHGTKPSK